MAIEPARGTKGDLQQELRSTIRGISIDTPLTALPAMIVHTLLDNSRLFDVQKDFSCQVSHAMSKLLAYSSDDTPADVMRVSRALIQKLDLGEQLPASSMDPFHIELLQFLEVIQFTVDTPTGLRQRAGELRKQLSDYDPHNLDDSEHISAPPTQEASDEDGEDDNLRLIK